MQITIFGKKKTSNDGKQFMSYFSTLTKKDGSTLQCSVKFRDECGAPKNVPINIVVEHKDCNFAEKNVKYTDKDGIEKEALDRTLWVQAWTEGEPYVDTSMDEFID